MMLHLPHFNVLQVVLMTLMALWTLLFLLRAKIKKWFIYVSYKQFKLHYFRGLNYLINDQPDQALDTFIKIQKIDGEGLEIHMALANLFRQRGEVDRAIRIHQDIILRPSIKSKVKARVMLELGKDYLKAGVLDRAEYYFLSSLKFKHQTKNCYLYLQEIYQREKKWPAAIEVTVKLRDGLQVEHALLKLSHYECELAAQCLQAEAYEQTASHLSRALKHDSGCARAYLIFAKMALSRYQYETSIHYLQRACASSLGFISEMIQPLFFCYQKLDDMDGFSKVMLSWLQSDLQPPCIDVMIDFLRKEPSMQWFLNDAFHFFNKKSSYFALSCRLQQLTVSAKPSSQKQQLQKTCLQLNELLDGMKHYLCEQCGFNTRTHYWLCPSCHQWASIKVFYPLHAKLQADGETEYSKHAMESLHPVR